MKIFDIIQPLGEAPIQDYKTIGDFDKNSSFRKSRDRHLITNPSTIKRVKDKFNNTDTNFNLFFVNSSKANKHTEVGKVSIEWVEENLGKEVADQVRNATDFDDSVNVIFTNNKGSEGVPMTGWIMAHRIAHALARYSGPRNRQFHSYGSTADQLHNTVSSIMDMYGKTVPDSWDKMVGRDFSEYGRASTRRSQLSYSHFMSKLCTFRSARENNVRDWFEFLHELFAQYITTGSVKFNDAPEQFGNRNTGVYRLKPEDRDDADHMIASLARGLEYMFDDMLSEATGSILVM